VLDAKTCREFARDCVRIAEKMNAKDRETLLRIAQAWEARALEAEAEKVARGRERPRRQAIPFCNVRVCTR
jgi:hypothetical protein